MYYKLCELPESSASAQYIRMPVSPFINYNITRNRFFQYLKKHYLKDICKKVFGLKIKNISIKSSLKPKNDILSKIKKLITSKTKQIKKPKHIFSFLSYGRMIPERFIGIWNDPVESLVGLAYK